MSEIDRQDVEGGQAHGLGSAASEVGAISPATPSTTTSRRLAPRLVHARPAWCDEHWDFGWLYDDKSGGCFYAYIVEMSSSNCRLVPLKALRKAKR